MGGVVHKSEPPENIRIYSAHLVIPNWTLRAQPNVAVATPNGMMKLKLPKARVPNS